MIRICNYIREEHQAAARWLMSTHDTEEKVTAGPSGNDRQVGPGICMVGGEELRNAGPRAGRHAGAADRGYATEGGKAPA